jgi:hypothetical protein
MAMSSNPQVNRTPADLPDDPEGRAAVEVDLFGQHLFFLRNRRLAALQRLISDADARSQLGTIRRRAYDAVASLDNASKSACLGLAQAAIDLYMQDFLSLLSSSGTALKLGDDHAIRYKLTMQVIDMDHNILWEDAITQSGVRNLPGYFGRWLNAYKSWGLEPPEEPSKIRQLDP